MKPGSPPDGTAASISVITLCWRNDAHAGPFAKSFQAARNAARQLSVELIVVVNGPDGANAADVITSHGVDAQVVQLATNEGFSGGANAGMRTATGDVVVIANLDVVFDPAFFTALAAALAEPWDALAPSVDEGPDRKNGVSIRTALHRLRFVGEPALPNFVEGGNGACLVLRSALIRAREAVNGELFDGELHSFNEDIDLFWWMQASDRVLRFDPAVRVSHVGAGSFGDRRRFVDRTRDVQRRVVSNYRVIVLKNMRGRDVPGWLVGEATYLGQLVVSRGLAGIATYISSFGLSIATIRAVRRRRGALRLASTSSR